MAHGASYRELTRTTVSKPIRSPCSADRRVVQVRILPPALEVLERLDGPIAGMAPALLGALSQREVKTLIELLDKLRAETG